MSYGIFLCCCALYICGIFYILHTGKALRTGVFIGWYNGSYQKYFVYRAKTPFKFYLDVIFMASVGAVMVAFASVIVDEHFHIFERLGL